MENRITEAAISEFKIRLIENEKSDATIEKYIRDVTALSGFTQGAPLCKQLIISYKESIMQTHAPASVNSMLASVNSFLKFMNLSDFCVRRLKIQRDAFCADDKELTKDEYLRLVKTAERHKNKRLCLALQTLCAAGLRVSELKFVTIAAAKQGSMNVNCKGKRRTVLLPKKLCVQLMNYAKSMKIISGSIFITKTGKPWDRTNLWKAMKALCTKAGVAAKKVFPHNLRHLFARAFYKLEKDVVKLADILGHSSINTTRIYTITTCAEHREHIEKLRLII